MEIEFPFVSIVEREEKRRIIEKYTSSIFQTNWKKSLTFGNWNWAFPLQSNNLLCRAARLSPQTAENEKSSPSAKCSPSKAFHRRVELNWLDWCFGGEIGGKFFISDFPPTLTWWRAVKWEEAENSKAFSWFVWIPKPKNILHQIP